MNNRAKGRRNETKARDLLVLEGFSVQLTPMPSKFSLQNDLFGLWDLMAVSSEKIRFIQVKSNKTAPKAWREEAIAWQCPSNCTKELWIFFDRVKMPKIIVL